MSIGRINKFLMSEELDEDSVSHDPSVSECQSRDAIVRTTLHYLVLQIHHKTRNKKTYHMICKSRMKPHYICDFCFTCAAFKYILCSHCLYFPYVILQYCRITSYFLFVRSMSCLLSILMSPVISEEAVKVDKGVFSWSRSEKPALRK